jgi:transposase InsO family protein
MNVNIACLERTSIGMKTLYRTVVCAILDDSSRMIIACREYVHFNTQNTIEVIDELVREYWNVCPLRDLILDHGSEFGAHRINENGSWDSEFKRHVKVLRIKLILAAVRHPQADGKVEKWFTHTRGPEASLKRSRNRSVVQRNLMSLET